MTTEKLKEYLGIVIDMEKNIYMQYQTIQEIQWEIDGLGLEQEIPKPDKDEQCERGTIEFMLAAFCFIIGFIFWIGKAFFAVSHQEPWIMLLFASFAIIVGLWELMSGFDKNIRQQGGQINRRLEALKKNSEVEVYCMEQAQRELHYMNRMDYLLGRNDGVFL